MTLCAQQKQSAYPPFLFTLSAPVASKNVDYKPIEVEQIVAAQKQVKGSSQEDIRYWNGAYPSYRWHQIMVKTGQKHKGHKNGGRMAVLHLAIYDALAEVRKQKQKVLRKAPYEEHENIVQWAEAPSYSSYICERSAVAVTAHAIISHYFPEQKKYLDSTLQEHLSVRLLTGLQYPSDLLKGAEIGLKIAKKYIDYSKTDGTNLKWKGSVPKNETLWSGIPNPYDPMKGKWRPFVLKEAKQFRPKPPPTDWSTEMEELHLFNKNNKSSSIAWKWRTEPVWDLLLERKILEYDLDAFEAAKASAVFHTARFDATIAAWDGKYHYWSIRPFQYDPSFEPLLVDTPNFPGYPAGHTTVAGSLATVLSHLFPRDAAEFHNLALECSESRFEGGVHFRTDNTVGLEIGEKVGKEVAKVFFN